MAPVFEAGVARQEINFADPEQKFHTMHKHFHDCDIRFVEEFINDVLDNQLVRGLIAGALCWNRNISDDYCINYIWQLRDGIDFVLGSINFWRSNRPKCIEYIRNNIKDADIDSPFELNAHYMTVAGLEHILSLPGWISATATYKAFVRACGKDDGLRAAKYLGKRLHKMGMTREGGVKLACRTAMRGWNLDVLKWLCGYFKLGKEYIRDILNVTILADEYRNFIIDSMLEWLASNYGSFLITKNMLYCATPFAERRTPNAERRTMGAMFTYHKPMVDRRTAAAIDRRIEMAIAVRHIEYLDSITDLEWQQSACSLRSWFEQICRTGYLDAVKWAFDRFKIKNVRFATADFACARFAVAQWLFPRLNLSPAELDSIAGRLNSHFSRPDVEQWAAVISGARLTWNTKHHAKLYFGWQAGAIIMASVLSQDTLRDVLAQLAAGRATTNVWCDPRTISRARSANGNILYLQ
jgi:hypothetical protein